MSGFRFLCWPAGEMRVGGLRERRRGDRDRLSKLRGGDLDLDLSRLR
jgi:hypothetical protein